MGIFRRSGSSVWHYDFIVRGQRFQGSTGKTNKRDAEFVFHKLKLEAHANPNDVARSDPNMTFAALVAEFFARGAARPHHRERLKFLLPFFGDLPLARLTRGLAGDYRLDRKAGKPISDATVNRDLSTLRHILYWAVDQSIIAANPVARLRLAAEPRKFRKIVSVSEEQRLLDAAPEHLREMALVAIDTGMRRGEITHQRREDIDMSRRLILVTKSKTIGGQLREIPMTGRVYDLLAGKKEREGYTFTYNGRPIRILKTAWKSTLRRAGLRHFRFHDLRHTFNTRLMEAGVVQDIRMALMGHSSGNQVHATYTHVELPAKRRAIARLESWLKEQAEAETEEVQGGTQHGDSKNA